MTFEQKSVELMKKKQLERYRKSFRRWFDPLRKLEPDYQEEQKELNFADAESKRSLP